MWKKKHQNKDSPKQDQRYTRNVPLLKIMVVRNIHLEFISKKNVLLPQNNQGLIY